MLVADGRVLRLSGAASKHGRIGGNLLLLGAPPFPSHNVRCAEHLRAKAAEKLGFGPDHKGYSRAALTAAWLSVAAAKKAAMLATSMAGATTMRAPAAVLAAAIVLAPLGVRAADRVVWWFKITSRCAALPEEHL